MIALADGHPWRDVDYRALGRAVWLDNERARLREIGRRMRRAVYRRHYPGRRDYFAHSSPLAA